MRSAQGGLSSSSERSTKTGICLLLSTTFTWLSISGYVTVVVMLINAVSP